MTLLLVKGGCAPAILIAQLETLFKDFYTVCCCYNILGRAGRAPPFGEMTYLPDSPLLCRLLDGRGCNIMQYRICVGFLMGYRAQNYKSDTTLTCVHTNFVDNVQCHSL